MKIVKKIKKSGWPVFTRSGAVSKKWKKSHSIANRKTLRKFGSKIAKAINKIKIPKSELLGSHTRSGKIIVSSKVPKHLRLAIAYHERIENRFMRKK